MAIFTWTPSTGITTEYKPRVTTASFGDGYSQRIRYGINTVAVSWGLTFVNQTLVKAKEITDFLELHGGAVAFTFTPPGSTTSFYVTCAEWSVEYTSHISRTITATFIKVNDIV